MKFTRNHLYKGMVYKIYNGRVTFIITELNKDNYKYTTSESKTGGGTIKALLSHLNSKKLLGKYYQKLENKLTQIIMKSTVKKSNKESSDSFQIGVYLMSLKKLHPEVTKYEEISRLLYDEFGVEYSERDIFNYYEPTIEEDILDYQLKMKDHGY